MEAEFEVVDDFVYVSLHVTALRYFRSASFPQRQRPERSERLHYFLNEIVAQEKTSFLNLLDETLLHAMRKMPDSKQQS